MKRKRTLHMFERDWHPDTLELQRRARKLLLDHGYPEERRYKAVTIDIRHDLRIYYRDMTLTISFQGDRVYTGTDDMGPWFEDKDLREQISATLVVLRSYMLLEDLSNV